MSTQAKIDEVRRLLAEDETLDVVRVSANGTAEAPYDTRLAHVGERVRRLDADARAMRVSAQSFRDVIQVLLVLPENDPRRLGGLMMEIDTDAGVIVQALERMAPRLRKALAILEPEKVATEKGLDQWA